MFFKANSVAVLILLPCVALAQEYPDTFDEPLTILSPALGTFTRPIATSSTKAQEFFDQGFQMMYAFAKRDAPRSFREAWKQDPDCAACYWGEAWSWGSYLNGPMGPDDAPRAHAAITTALGLVDDETAPVERGLIDAMAVRYEPEHDRDRRAVLDTVYAEAMSRLFDRYPRDLDVGTLYAEALMLLEPRRGRWDIDDPDVVQIHEVLESVLGQDITHPGACHLYIHATESTSRPDKPEACAEYLGDSIPGASHINHMPSHVWNRVGRWGEAVRANVKAWHSDLKAEIDEGFAIYPTHNLHMLLFAASMDGQGAIAIQAGKDYGELVTGGVFYEVLTLLRFGRFEEILEMTDTPENPIYRGFWDFGRGYAHLRVGDPDNARVYLERVERAASETERGFRGHSAEDLLGIVGRILRAELYRHEGRVDDAISQLEQAVELEDGLRYDEPEPLNFSARHWLGDALLEANRPADAEAVFNAALEDHPKNGWSLMGLEQAVRAQDRAAEADSILEDFSAAWARSDTWIRAPIF